MRQILSNWLVLWLLAISTILLGSLSPRAAAATILYDDTQGNLPADQSWLFYADDTILNLFDSGNRSASQISVSGGVQYTTNDSVRGGYSSHTILGSLWNPSFPTLNRQTGFELTFEAQLHTENHNSTDRAGFSVILLAEDKKGIELGFWENEIWAQNDTPLFTHGDGVSFDTTAAEVLYTLTILGDNYSLNVDGAPILSGALQDYTGFNDLPYTLGSYLFLGDDTTSASADITLGTITIDNSPISHMPGPSSLILLTTLAPFGFRMLRPQKKS